ncbi:hypothetical protein [Asticcacaulis excentricus]|uniref:YD repeat-containing protein n=1 Tax=Asticcacaulis excentricus (strain ATCC 15261 / DSM 4724 / KCTC 12464 / NCIMB 9791 / VKM B-1370 / CB 48) TaxID=573065 RepID=E8RVT1_ASTEC|nr:hypothetical protein [Asticcacaulis excentricus]ADU15353.1 hypothetical protein Astex_3739 [Asticcacaulis excentricus CB 48]
MSNFVYNTQSVSKVAIFTAPLILTFILVSNVFAQTQPQISNISDPTTNMSAPKSSSDLGADLTTGAFTFSRLDGYAGGGEFPQMLSIRRTYSSKNLQYTVFGSRFSNSFDITYTIGRLKAALNIMGQAHELDCPTAGVYSCSLIGSNDYTMTEPGGGWTLRTTGQGTYTPGMGYEYKFHTLVATGPDGSRITFFTARDSSTCPAGEVSWCFKASSWEFPTGEKVYFKYDYMNDEYRLMQVSNNYGHVVRFYRTNDILNYVNEIRTFTTNNVCAVGQEGPVQAIDLCDPGSSAYRSIFYDFLNVTFDYGTNVASLYGVSDGIGQIERYEYDSYNFGHPAIINRILDGNGTVSIINYYKEFIGNRLSDNYLQLTRQIDASGKELRYTFFNSNQSNLQAPPDTAIIQDALNNQTIYHISGSTWAKNISKIDYADGFSTSYEYDQYIFKSVQKDFKNKEGDIFRVAYDMRGNMTRFLNMSKPSHGLPPLIEEHTYISNCTNRVTCNKPQSIRDPNGSYIYLEYYEDHGGLKSATRYDLNNVPVSQIRYYFEPMFVNFKDSAGNVVANSGPIYKLKRESSCLESAPDNISSCIGGPREQIKEYSYNNDNLYVTSETVKSGDGSLVTTKSFGYDQMGNVTSIDGPRTDVDDTAYTTYDQRRRIVFEIGPDPDGACHVNGDGCLKRQITRHFYNLNNEEIRTEFGNGNNVDGSDFTWTSAKRMTYNGAGQLTKTETLVP